MAILEWKKSSENEWEIGLKMHFADTNDASIKRHEDNIAIHNGSAARDF